MGLCAAAAALCSIAKIAVAKLTATVAAAGSTAVEWKHLKDDWYLKLQTRRRFEPQQFVVERVAADDLTTNGEKVAAAAAIWDL